MNERIKELAVQAWLADNIEQYPEYKKNEMTEYLLRDMEGFHKKFAELIVQECVDIVENSPWNLPHGYKAVDQANLVKKHFGVEE